MGTCRSFATRMLRESLMPCEYSWVSGQGGGQRGLRSGFFGRLAESGLYMDLVEMATE